MDGWMDGFRRQSHFSATVWTGLNEHMNSPEYKTVLHRCERVGLDERSCSIPGPVITWMGDRDCL